MAWQLALSEVNQVQIIFPCLVPAASTQGPKTIASLLPRITPLHVIITILCSHFDYLKLL